LDVGLLKKMLPMLAMAVAGFIGKGGSAEPPAASSGGGGLGGLVGGLIGGMTGKSGGSRGGGLAALLDMDGDGNPLDDIL